MSNALRKTMTLDEFLAWEERQDTRHEFDGFETVATLLGVVVFAAVVAALYRYTRRAADHRPVADEGAGR